MSILELKKIVGLRYKILEYPISHPKPVKYNEKQYSARQIVLTSLDDLYNYMDIKGHKSIALYQFDSDYNKLWFESF